MDPSIRLDKIKIQSQFRVNGFYVFFRGKTGHRLIWGNNTSLCLEPKWNNYISYLEKFEKNGNMNRFVTKEENEHLYSELLKKHSQAIFSKRPNSFSKIVIAGQEKFKDFDIEKQCVALSQLISATSIGSSIADMTMIGGTARTGYMLTNQKISGYELVLINTSPTGLNKTEIDLNTI